jgi:hypothetical protein
MLQLNEKPVMDVLPFPNGRGFSGASAWWDYVMSKEERQRLDNLMGLALLDENVRDRLIHKRDESLLGAFGLSRETQNWLRAVNASSLTELAEAIVGRLHTNLTFELAAS